jgi:transcriptional/translational regulatory protein YebC/TACO1
VKDEEDEYQVITTFENLQECTENLEKAGFKAKSAEFTRIPENSIEITDVKVAQNILRLMEKLEDHDDVQNVYSNFDISDELMAQVEI